MRIDIMTLFPDSMRAVLGESIIGRAAKKGVIDIHCTQIRDYTDNKQMQVDDYPYGGGWGCVMMAQPLKACLDDVMQKAGPRNSRVIYMSPQGKPFTQAEARRLVADYDHLVLVCGHYEGIDERFIEECVDEELSIGDYVLTGGELAAMVVTDCVCRMVPGVLSDPECYTGESHWNGLLEYPQYTRPETWQGRTVPEILRGGDHAKIEHWRRKQQLERTRLKRPDLFAQFRPDETDEALLAELEKERSRMKLTKPVTCLGAVPEDLPVIMELLAEARKRLAKARVDVWQGPYPGEGTFREDIAQGNCYVLLYGNEIAGAFSLVGPGEVYHDEDLTDGKWHGGAPYVVLRRNMVGGKFVGSGMADYEMRFAEEVAKSRGAGSIRLLTHKKNLPMKQLLSRHGYRFAGNVEVEIQPGRMGARQAFEKELK